MTDYAELRAALPAATPGPWFVHGSLGHAVATVGKVRIASDAHCTNRPEEDATYIAACHPNAIRALLAERDAMKAMLEEALIWHESQDKAISKQPNANFGSNGLMRVEHQEQAALIRAALAQGEV